MILPSDSLILMKLLIGNVYNQTKGQKKKKKKKNDRDAFKIVSNCFLAVLIG